MSDELQVVSDTAATIVGVAARAEEVLRETVVIPVVIESTDAQVITVEDESTVVAEVPDVTVVSVGEVGPPGPQGVQGTAGTGGAETYTAGEAVGGHRVLVADSSGQVIYADYTNADHANQAMRLSLNAAVQGASVVCQIAGRVVDPSFAWTPGATLYVGANAVLTHTLPVSPAVFRKPIAVAESATSIILIQEPPTMLA